MDLVIEPTAIRKPELTLKKGYGIAMTRSYGDDEWTNRFIGYGKLYLRALELAKKKLELEKEHSEARKNRKSWRELDNLPALERARYRAEYIKIDDDYGKRFEAIQTKCDGLGAELLDEKIAEEKALKSHGVGGDLKKAGPFIGPKGGKWKDPQHKIPWVEPKQEKKLRAEAAEAEDDAKHWTGEAAEARKAGKRDDYKEAVEELAMAHEEASKTYKKLGEADKAKAHKAKADVAREALERPMTKEEAAGTPVGKSQQLVVDLKKAEEPPPKKPPKEYREAGATKRAQYADPKGWKYPIDTEAHVRAAVSYFSKPKNAGVYPVEEQKRIWSRIKRAAKRFKIELGKESGPPSVQKSRQDDGDLHKAGEKPKTTTIQTLIFDKDKFDPKKARAWAVEHDFVGGKVDVKEESVRLRQKDPSEFQDDSFRTITLTDGVKAVIGRPKKAPKAEKMAKAGPHKYISRKKVKGKWRHTYAKEGAKEKPMKTEHEAKLKEHREAFHAHAESSSRTDDKGEKLYHMKHMAGLAKRAAEAATKAGNPERAESWRLNHEMRSRGVRLMREDGIEEKVPLGWLPDGTERGSFSPGEKITISGKPVTVIGAAKGPGFNVESASGRKGVLEQEETGRYHITTPDGKTRYVPAPEKTKKSLRQIEDLDEWLEKAGPHKYVSRKKVKGKWQYTYAEEAAKKPVVTREAHGVVAEHEVLTMLHSGAGTPAQFASAAKRMMAEAKEKGDVAEFHRQFARKDIAELVSTREKDIRGKSVKEAKPAKEKLIADAEEIVAWHESNIPEATKKSLELLDDFVDSEAMPLRKGRSPVHLTPANQRELTAHADAVLRSRIAKGLSDIQIEPGYVSTLTKSRGGELVAKQHDAALVNPVPLVHQRVLCKSVFQGGCEAHFSGALSACPECGAGTIEARGLPPREEIGVDIASDARGLRPPRRPPDVKIED